MIILDKSVAKTYQEIFHSHLTARYLQALLNPSEKWSHCSVGYQFLRRHADKPGQIFFPNAAFLIKIQIR